jgi:hypothetical protein
MKLTCDIPFTGGGSGLGVMGAAIGEFAFSKIGYNKSRVFNSA